MTKEFLEKDIEILISTMNKDSLDFLIPMFPFIHFSNFQILIVNQTQNEKILTSRYSSVRIINSFEKGLAKSRNLALENAVGKILVIADDDVVYQEGFGTKISNAYQKYPNAAVIKFCALKSNGKLLNQYPVKSKSNLNIFDILNTSSIELTFNKFNIDLAKHRFDDNFGLGGIFEMGEEAVFLSDLKKDSKELVFESQIIVEHNDLTSADKSSVTERYFISGALFTRIFRKKYIFWIFIKIFFDLKHKKIKISNLKTVLKNAVKGHKKFQKIKA